MMASVATVKKEDAGEATAPRALPVVEPSEITIEHAGQIARWLFIRLPNGAIADDLKEPSIWKKVQTGSRALRLHDQLYLVSFNEDWAATAIVGQANSEVAVLAGVRIITFPQRTKPLFQDETYRVVWAGNGYRVERKRDRVMMTQPVTSEAVAIRELSNLYPRPVS
jgi:hypothetical protein